MSWEGWMAEMYVLIANISGGREFGTLYSPGSDSLIVLPRAAHSIVTLQVEFGVKYHQLGIGSQIEPRAWCCAWAAREAHAPVD